MWIYGGKAKWLAWAVNAERNNIMNHDGYDVWPNHQLNITIWILDRSFSVKFMMVPKHL